MDQLQQTVAVICGSIVAVVGAATAVRTFFRGNTKRARRHRLAEDDQAWTGRPAPRTPPAPVPDLSPEDWFRLTPEPPTNVWASRRTSRSGPFRPTGARSQWWTTAGATGNPSSLGGQS